MVLSPHICLFSNTVYQIISFIYYFSNSFHMTCIHKSSCFLVKGAVKKNYCVSMQSIKSSIYLDCGFFQSIFYFYTQVFFFLSFILK